MNKLNQVLKNPSGFDSMSNYAGEIPDENWYVVLTRTRDADVLSESNFETALTQLDGESDDVQIFRFGHWACGYWEALCVNSSNNNKFKIASEIYESIQNYPVLNEDDFSEREQVKASEIWLNCYNKQDRIDYIRKHKSQFDFSDFSDLMSCIRGEYFSGYASELF